MEPQAFFRLGAVGLLGLALLAAAFTTRQLHAPEPTTTLPATVPADPIATELTRCRNLGVEAASDPTCKEVWAQNRARFFSPPKAPLER